MEQPPQEEIFDGEILDAEVINQSGGVYDVAWPLLGMDCPDCASKAMRAISYLPQVSESVVSATASISSALFIIMFPLTVISPSRILISGDECGI